MGVIRGLCEEMSSEPEDEDEPYVISYQIKSPDDFNIVMSTNRLLKLFSVTIRRNVDGTYKLLKSGHPVIVMGVDDADRVYHPSILSLTATEQGKYFATCAAVSSFICVTTCRSHHATYLFVTHFQSQPLAKDFQYVVEAQEKTAPTVPKEIHLMADAAPAIRNGMDVAVKRRTPTSTGKRSAGGVIASKKSRRKSGDAGNHHGDGPQNSCNDADGGDDDEATSAGLTETSSTASCLLGDDDHDDGDGDVFEAIFGDYDDECPTKASFLDSQVPPLANLESVVESLDKEGEPLVSSTCRLHVSH